MSAHKNSVRSRFFGPGRWSVADFPLGQIDGPFGTWTDTLAPPLHRGDGNLIEKSLETLVALQFGFITGAEPTAIVTSRPMCSDPDVVALDNLGRIHLVELKKQSLTAKDVEQAEQYMLRLVFRDVADFMNRWAEVEGARNRTLQLSIAGLWANVDPGKEGHQLAKRVADVDKAFHGWCCQHFGQRFPSKAHWTRLHKGGEGLPPDPAAMVRLLQHVAAKGDEQRVEEMAHAQLDLVSRLERGSPFCRASAPAGDGASVTSKPKLVLWLGAPVIGDDALERIERLRLLGVDARCFEIRGRLDEQKAVRLQVRKEYNPDRDALEAIVADHMKESSAETGRIEWNLYCKKTPSERGGDSAARAALDSSDGRRWAPSARLKIGDGMPQDISAYDALHRTARCLQVGEPELLSRLETAVAHLLCAPWMNALTDAPELLRLLQPIREERWGRLGVSLLGPSWRPGVFVGFVCNGWDHGVMPSDSSQGLDLSVILDTTEERRPTEPASYSDWFIRSDGFQNTLRRLSALPDWNVCDATRFGGNCWHPIHLRRPLMPLLRAGKEELVSAACEGVRLLAQGDELRVREEGE